MTGTLGSPDTTIDSTRLAQSLATITTDTGDFAPGPRSFARYTDPLWCLEAAHHARDVQRTSLAAQASLDTLQLTPERNTLPAGVAAVARACGGHFTVAGTAAPELPELFELALLEGNETLAHAVVARRLALAPTDSTRRQLSLWTIGAYLRAEPARVAAAESLVAQVDAQGPPAQLARLAAHAQLLAFGESTFDQGRIRQEAERIIALAQELTMPELQAQQRAGESGQPGGGWLLRQAYEALMALAYVNHPDSMPALAQRIQQAYRRPVLRSYVADAEHHDRSNNDQGRTISPSTMPIAQVIAEYLPFSRLDFPKLGTPSPPVRAAYWFPAAAGDTVQPARGHVSLVLNTFNWQCLYHQQWVITGAGQNCGQAEVARLRRWLQQYQAAGLTVIVVVGVGDNGASVLEQAPAPPATVAQTLARYLRDELQLPVTLAVDTVPVALHVPAPDGRTFDGPMALTKQYSPPANSSLYFPDQNIVVLTDRDGKLLYKGNRLDDPVLNALLARAVGTHSLTKQLPPAGTSAAASPPASDLPPGHTSHP